MILFKNIFLFTLLITISHTVEGHGPSRQKVSEKIEINAPSAKVWELVKNFQAVNWNSNVKSVNANGNEIGSERELKFGNGELVKQKLEKINEEKKFVQWRIIETDNKILPVNSYAAKIFVKNQSDGLTEVNYKAGFYRGFMGNDPPDELNDENSKKKVSNFIINSLKGLKNIAEKK